MKEKRNYIAMLRGLMSDEELQRYQWNVSGAIGEEGFAAVLAEFGSPDWVVYRNIWLEKDNLVEADFLVAAPGRWVVFEVKNYRGSVTVSGDDGSGGGLGRADGFSHSRGSDGADGNLFNSNTASSHLGLWLNGKHLSRNPLHQVAKTRSVVESIARAWDSRIQVDCAVVLINDYCYIDGGGNPSRPDIPILTKAQLKDYFYNLCRNMVGSFSGRQLKSLADHLASFQRENPYAKTGFDLARLSSARTGVNCGACGSFEVGRNHKTLFCNQCNATESIYHSFIRTINEYLLLTTLDTCATKEIRWFTGNFYSQNYISYHLGRSFKRDSNYKRGYFIDCRNTCERLLKEEPI